MRGIDKFKIIILKDYCSDRILSYSIKSGNYQLENKNIELSPLELYSNTRMFD
jgi:hypothetical protein